MMPQTNRIRTVLRADPIWSAYARADLRPDLAPFCRWAVAGGGLSLLYTGLKIPILLTVGPLEGVETVLARSVLPERVYLNVREEHLPAVHRYYDDSGEPSPMLRMFLPAAVAAPPPGHPVERLGPAHAERLRRLYAHGGAFAPDLFDPAQIEDGVYRGIVDGRGELAAAGGTHIVNQAESVAAIGNIYTRPDCRGRGYARAVTAAIVRQLRAQDIDLIVLNVDRRNHAARALYGKLGFVEHCPFVEGIAVRRNA